jgi:hypothetical protein
MTAAATELSPFIHPFLYLTERRLRLNLVGWLGYHYNHYGKVIRNQGRDTKRGNIIETPVIYVVYNGDKQVEEKYVNVLFNA